MKTRQFGKLAGLPQARRIDLVCEGLLAIGANVVALADELERCNESRAFRSARLAYNAGREEAGKFLILLDAWRAPDAGQGIVARQFKRAGNHLAKLIYAQMADYSIASQHELVGAVNRHRKSLYLDGPNDYDWIFRNDLLTERESALYVDLVDSDGKLEWWTPTEHEMSIMAPCSIRLVQALLSTELVTPAGLKALEIAWSGFDAQEDSHCRSWQERTIRALLAFPDSNLANGRLSAGASLVADQWPMPMVELAVEEDTVSPESLHAERDAALSALMRSEVGEDW